MEKKGRPGPPSLESPPAGHDPKNDGKYRKGRNRDKVYRDDINSLSPEDDAPEGIDGIILWIDGGQPFQPVGHTKHRVECPAGHEEEEV